MDVSPSQIERARAIMLAAAIAFDRGDTDNPITYVKPHWSELGFVLTATREQAEVLVRADRFSRIEKQRLDGMAYLVYLDMLMDFADPGSPTLLRQAFWMKTLVGYNSRVKELVVKRRWQEYEVVCGEYLEEARRTGSPVCMLRPLVRMAHAKLMTGNLDGCGHCLDEFDAAADAAPTGPGADLVPGDLTAAELAAGMRQEADELRRHLNEQLRRRRR